MPDRSEAAVRARWAALVADRICAEEGCGRPAYSRGLCRVHYHRWHRASAWRLSNRWVGHRGGRVLRSR